MGVFAIWKDKKVIGYIRLTQEQRDEMNSIKEIGIYIGFDKNTRPDMYKKEE